MKSAQSTDMLIHLCILSGQYDGRGFDKASC